jgi:S1-C subfamily serine protease
MPSDPRISSLVAAIAGGLVVLIVGAALLVTDVIDTGETTREVVRQAPIAGSASNKDGGLTVRDIYRRDAPGVVFIEARIVRRGESPFGIPVPEQGTSTGSGFVLDKEGNILTNAHVVEGARDVTVQFERGDTVDATVEGTDLSSDLAVLKVETDSKKLKPLRLGDSSAVKVGDPTIAIGNPFGFDRTATTGIVSALQRQIEAPNGFTISNVIQTDAAINPGNSGGPLLDGTGKVIGVNSQIATPGQGSVGIAFAVPIDTAKQVIPQLQKGKRVQRAYLGVSTVTATKQIAEAFNLARDAGALVQSVDRNGPADKAGIRGGRIQTTEGLTGGGDLIVKIEGKDIRTSQDVAAAIADKKPGDRVKVEYYRGDDRKTAEVRLGTRPPRLDRPSSRQAPPETLPLP